MKKLRLLSLSLLLLAFTTVFGGCHATYYKVPVTKSRKHFRPYDNKRDKRKKRVKVKKYKSLKSTKGIHAD